MTITTHKGRYALNDRFFTVDSVDFEITGTEIDRYGNTIDHVKNVKSGKHAYIGRVTLVNILTQAGYKTKRFGK